MKKFFLIIYLFCFFTELPVVGMAIREGCQNSSRCGLTQPLCDICEVEKYPDRFQACLFCRKPLRQVSIWSKNFDCHYSSRCFECSARAKAFLTNALLVTEDITFKDKPGLQQATNYKHREALEKGIEGYFKWADLAFKMKCIKGLRAYRSHKDIFGSVKAGVAKPYFYLGAKLNKSGKPVHIWSQELVIDPADKKFVLDVEEARKHVAQIWLKYKFFGPETGTIIEKEVTDKMLTYEEGTVVTQVFDYGSDESDGDDESDR